MRRLFLCVLLLAVGCLPSAGPIYAQDAQQVASYTMQVRLDPVAKTISGTEQITYRNPSEDTLNEVWMRLYLKAFSSMDSVWMRESGGQLRGDQVQPDQLGDITLHSLTSNGVDLLASSALTDTLLRVPLREPLLPNQSVVLEANWTSTLPRVFARTGYGGPNDTFFMVGQWYPKMAVYDRGRWDTEPWHGNSEFFNDFGSYDVQITVPQEYVVAGAGVPAGETAGSDGTKTLRFTSENVTDFAFAASPDFKTASTTSGPTQIDLFYMPEHESAVTEYLTSASTSVAKFGEWYGAYPHPRLTVVDVPDDAPGAGGMEYPTLITGEFAGGIGGFVSYVTAHEIAHQWWPMQTATNEGAEPWLDEGLTEYSGLRYMAETNTRLNFSVLGTSALTYEHAAYSQSADQPATLPAWEYSSGSYATVYFKTALGMWTLENTVGTEQMRAAMQRYLATYRYKHPTAADFRASIEGSLGPQTWFFDEYMPTGAVIDYAIGPVSDTAVEIERVGDVRVPVDIALTLADGQQINQTWDGQDETLQIATSSPAHIIEIDPAQKLVAEIETDNNYYQDGPQYVPALTLAERFAFVMQWFAQLIGLFG